MTLIVSFVKPFDHWKETLLDAINSVVSVDINGLQEEEGSGYDIDGLKGIKLLGAPFIGSRIGVTYLY